MQKQAELDTVMLHLHQLRTDCSFSSTVPLPIMFVSCLCAIVRKGFFSIFRPCYWRESSHELGQYHRPQYACCHRRGVLRAPESESRRSCVLGPSKAIYSLTWIKKKKKNKTTSPSCNAYINDLLFIIFIPDFYIMDQQVFPTPQKE